MPPKQPVLVIRDERFVEHLENMPHLESCRRIQAAHSILENKSIAGKWMAIPARPASRDELALVHTPEHIARIAESAGKPLTSFDPDTQATEKSYDTARLAAGAVFTLIDRIWGEGGERGFAFIRPPGHHAEPNRAMGFCIFNNIALGARYLKAHYGMKRVMIIDIDAHHGNGTQAAFFDTDDVLYISVHQFPAYPGSGNFGAVGSGKGEGYTVNIPLEKGAGDRDLAAVMNFLVKPLAQAYRPEAILVSCGFDFYVHDRLCGMRVTPEGYALITFFLLDIAERFGGNRIAFVMEGGYSLKGIRECGLRIMQELCNVPTLHRRQIEKIIDSKNSRRSVIKKGIEVQRKYWKNL